MTQEEKQLLLIDLCARLPYGVKVDREWIAPMSGSSEHSIMKFDTFDIEVIQTSIELGEAGNYRDSKMQGLTTCDDGRNHFVRGYMCKPYLRPMESMTEEEKEEFRTLIFPEASCAYEDGLEWDTQIIGGGYLQIFVEDFSNVINWLNEHHFDYRGLIPKGMAVEVTEENNPYKET